MAKNIKHYTIMKVLEIIKEVCSKAVPGYSFEFETERMMNVLADDIKFPLIFWEEYTMNDGHYSEGTGGMRKTVPVELSFMKLGPLDNPNPDAIERERIREEIEEEAIRPFIECLNSCGKVTPVKDFTITPQPPLFDTNAVSLLLRFSVTYKLCW